MEPFTNALIDYGIAGLFLAYMIWTKWHDQKRADLQQKRYEDKIEKMSATSFVEQEKIRSRYRDVVEKYDLQIKTYADERQTQIQTYAEERQEARRENERVRTHLETTLKEIKNDVAENGKSIARLQTQMENWHVRISR